MKNNVYLFQPQNLTSYNGSVIGWLPYSVACIWAYANQFKEVTDNYQLVRTYATKDPIQEVIDTLENPSILGFSTFVWNQNYNLTLAKAIRNKWPECKIIFGGPQLTHDWIEKYSFIDSIIEGEGEILFKEFLDDCLQGSTKKLYNKERIKDLTILPSGYATGIFDALLSQYPEFDWATTLETNRGCPYHCTFCDWGSVTNSKIFKISLDKVQADVDWIKKSKVIKIVNIADANFGILKERDLDLAKMLRTMVDDGPVEMIDISYTKSFNTYLYDIVKILDQNTGFTMSFQSNNKDTLDAIKRINLNEKDLTKLLNYAEEEQITHEQEYILGLPLETKESWYDGMTTLLSTGQHKVFDVFLCSLLPNTELTTPESRRKYGIESVFTPSINYVGTRNRENIVEYVEIIKQTNTLPRKELIDCYLFSLLIMHAHCTGYSFLVSRIANKIYNIDYRTYYERLEQRLYNDPTFGPHINYIRELLNQIFDTGEVQDLSFKEEGRFDYLSYQFFYKNKNRLIDLAVDALDIEHDQKMLKDIKNIQQKYIFDLSSKGEPSEFTSQIDIKTFMKKPTKYKSTNNIFKDEFITQWKGNGSFHTLHQSKKLINTFTEIPTARTKLEQISIDLVTE